MFLWLIPVVSRDLMVFWDLYQAPWYCTAHSVVPYTPCVIVPYILWFYTTCSYCSAHLTLCMRTKRHISPNVPVLYVCLFIFFFILSSVVVFNNFIRYNPAKTYRGWHSSGTWPLCRTGWHVEVWGALKPDLLRAFVFSAADCWVHLCEQGELSPSKLSTNYKSYSVGDCAGTVKRLQN